MGIVGFVNDMTRSYLRDGDVENAICKRISGGCVGYSAFAVDMREVSCLLAGEDKGRRLGSTAGTSHKKICSSKRREIDQLPDSAMRLGERRAEFGKQCKATGGNKRERIDCAE